MILSRNIGRAAFSRNAIWCSSRALSWISSNGSPITASYVVTRPRLTIPFPRRQFSLSRSLAEQSSPLPKPDFEPMKRLSETTLFKKVSGDPETIQEMTLFFKMLQAKGIDPTSGRNPSTMQLLKLLGDSEFKEAAKRLQARFQALGIDLQYPEVLAELSALKKP